MTTEEYNKLIEQIPLIPGWLEEIGRRPGELKMVNVNCEPIRDLEGEAREGHGWKMYKPGNVFEFTLYLTDQGVLTRLVSRVELESLRMKASPEDKPA